MVTVRPSFSLTRVRSCVSAQRQRHRRLELAVGQLRHVLRHAGDADVVLDEVVVRSEVRVVDRPVLAVAVERLALEILLAQAVALASPDVRASADDAQCVPAS